MKRLAPKIGLSGSDYVKKKKNLRKNRKVDKLIIRRSQLGSPSMSSNSSSEFEGSQNCDQGTTDVTSCDQVIPPVIPRSLEAVGPNALLCMSLLEDLVASLPCFKEPPKVPKLTIKAPTRIKISNCDQAPKGVTNCDQVTPKVATRSPEAEGGIGERHKRKKNKKKHKKEREDKHRVPKIKIKLPAAAQGRSPTPPVTVTPPPPATVSPLKLKINLPQKGPPTAFEKGIKLKLAKCPECNLISVLCACAAKQRGQERETAVPMFPARKVRPGPKNRVTAAGNNEDSGKSTIASTVATAVAAMASSPSRSMTPPLCPRKSLSPCPPPPAPPRERRRSLSSRKEKWVFDTRPALPPPSPRRDVVVKNPPVFARKSRAASVERQDAGGGGGQSSHPPQREQVPPALPAAAPIVSPLPTVPRVAPTRGVAPTQTVAPPPTVIVAPPPTGAPHQPGRRSKAKKAKSPDLLQKTMQAIKLESMGDPRARKVFNVIDSLFVETFRENEGCGEPGNRESGDNRKSVQPGAGDGVIAHLPQPESQSVVSRILDGILDGVFAPKETSAVDSQDDQSAKVDEQLAKDVTTTAEIKVGSPTVPKRCPPRKRPSSADAFSRSCYVSKKRRMLARQRSAGSLTNEPTSADKDVTAKATATNTEVELPLPPVPKQHLPAKQPMSSEAISQGRHVSKKQRMLVRRRSVGSMASELTSAKKDVTDKATAAKTDVAHCDQVTPKVEIEEPHLALPLDLGPSGFIDDEFSPLVKEEPPLSDTASSCRDSILGHSKRVQSADSRFVSKKHRMLARGQSAESLTSEPTSAKKGATDKAKAKESLHE